MSSLKSGVGDYGERGCGEGGWWGEGVVEKGHCWEGGSWERGVVEKGVCWERGLLRMRDCWEGGFVEKGSCWEGEIVEKGICWEGDLLRRGDCWEGDLLRRGDCWEGEIIEKGLWKRQIASEANVPYLFLQQFIHIMYALFQVRSEGIFKCYVVQRGVGGGYTDQCRVALRRCMLQRY